MGDFKDAADAFMTEASALTELLRSQRVRDLEILDTAPEPIFDEIVELACQMTGVSSSALVMIEGERSFVKATHNSPYLGNHDRRSSICDTAIQTPTETMIVSDPRKDERFADNPYVNKGEVNFYVGVPLLDNDGYALGTLCVFEDLPCRHVDPKSISLLEQLSRLTMSILRWRTGNKKAKN